MSDSDKLIEAYLLHSDNPSDATFGAWEEVTALAFENAEKCFDVILGLLKHASCRSQLSYIAAGPLEDVLNNLGPAIIARLDTEVATNYRLLYALGCVWLEQGSQTAVQVQSILDRYDEKEIDRMVDLPPLIPNIDTVAFVWAEPRQIVSVWALEEQFRTTWAHPKSFFEESLQYQRVLLAVDHGLPLAYLVYEIIWGNTAFLSLLKVSPDYQRIGIGKKMVALLEERLVSLKFGSYVTSSETTNPNTKRFFPDLGFAFIGELQMAHGGEMFYLKKLPAVD